MSKITILEDIRTMFRNVSINCEGYICVIQTHSMHEYYKNVICYACHKPSIYSTFNVKAADPSDLKPIYGFGDISGGCVCGELECKIHIPPEDPHHRGNIYPDIPSCLNKEELVQPNHYFSDLP